MRSTLLDYQENTPVVFEPGVRQNQPAFCLIQTAYVFLVFISTISKTSFARLMLELSGFGATWTDVVMELWDDGCLQNVYPNLAKLREACVGIMTYGRPYVYFLLCDCNPRLFPNEWLSGTGPSPEDAKTLSMRLIIPGKGAPFHKTQSFSVQDSQS